MVFLHKDDNFLPYTPRRKENLHENLHGLEKEALVESLELTIRKEVMNMYLLSTYRVFLHKTEPLNPPPTSHLPSSTVTRLCQAQWKRILRLQRHWVLQRWAAEDHYHVWGGHPCDWRGLQEAHVHHAGLQVVYIVPLLALAPPLYQQLRQSSDMWLPVAEYAGQVINSGACLCKGWLPCLFQNKGGVKAKDSSILFAIRSVESALLRCHELLVTFPGQDNKWFPRGYLWSLFWSFVVKLKAAGCFIIDSLKLQVVYF